MDQEVPDDGGPRVSLREASFGMPRLELVAFVGSGLVIGIPLLIAARVVAGPGASLLTLPIAVVSFLIPATIRSSYKAWRGGLSPIPRVRVHSVVQVNVSAEAALDCAAEAIRSIPRCMSGTLRREPAGLMVDMGLCGASWGEHITISTRPGQEGTTIVKVASRPLMRTTILDSGTNQRNVRIVVSSLRNLAATHV